MKIADVRDDVLGAFQVLGVVTCVLFHDILCMPVRHFVADWCLLGIMVEF